MKVTTDGCLFGAWIAKTVVGWQLTVDRTLDIGCGTGLLSLMVAQKINIQIDAVEIDEPAATQAQQNFAASPWANTLRVYNTSIQQFCQQPTKQYDIIITNPPFFNNDLKSDNAKRNIALHSSALSLEELLIAIQKLLLPAGKFAILLPYHRLDFFIKLAADAGFYLHKKTMVKQTPKHSNFRVMLLFGYEPTTSQEEAIIIKIDNEYTEDFKTLLRDYYLNTNDY
ncbi:MAG: methyltransferase [Pedobacter sp.]|nr:methyltransferase [Chitinophagaceae bacterium]